MFTISITPPTRDFGVVGAGETHDSEVTIAKAPSDSTVTARITDDDSDGRFTLDIAVFQVELGPNGRPLGLNKVDESDGSSSLQVEKGQLLTFNLHFKGVDRPPQNEFSAKLIISAAGWSVPVVPLFAGIGKIQTTLQKTGISLTQGEVASIPVLVQSLSGPDTVVGYSLALPSSPGISIIGGLVTVPRGQTVSATLQFQTFFNTPPGDHVFALFESAFNGSHRDLVKPSVTLSVRPRQIPIAVIAAAIDEKYSQVNGRKGPLGLATSEIVEDSTGRILVANGDPVDANQSFTRLYSGGRITLDSDGNLEGQATIETIVRYKGLHCFGETRGAGSDEPYAIVAVYGPETRNMAQTKKFPGGDGTYEGVEDGSQRTEGIEDIISLAPQDLVILCTVMEGDEGNKGAIRDAIDRAVRTAADAGSAAAGVPISDGDVNTIVNAVGGLLGLGDDLIGSQAIQLKRHDLFSLPRPHDFGIINFNVESPLLTDGDASYKLYFEVITRAIDPPKELTGI